MKIEEHWMMRKLAWDEKTMGEGNEVRTRGRDEARTPLVNNSTISDPSSDLHYALKRG
jgi:hypothetical protein